MSSSAAAAKTTTEPATKKIKGEEVQAPPHDDDSDDSESDEDDDLNLEGVLVRNPDVSDSDDDEDEEERKPAAATKATAVATSTSKKSATTGSKRKRKSSKKNKPEMDVTMVDFTFWDMREKFFHGIKTLLHSSSTVYAPQSSSLSDLMIDNVSVGTVLSTEGDEEGNVFGFASVLNVSTYSSENAIKCLKNFCLQKCPKEHEAEMKTVLSGKTARPAGFLLHCRMVNLPLEIVEVLHQQLVLDMDWAVKNAEGGEAERKSLDFGAFVRIAPASTSSGSGGLVYKYFDDEIFATNAEFTYTVDAPKSFGQDAKQLCSIIVMTKTGHRAAMEDLRKLVGSG